MELYGVFSGEMGSLNQDMWYNSLVGDVVVLFGDFLAKCEDVVRIKRVLTYSTVQGRCCGYRMEVLW